MVCTAPIIGADNIVLALATGCILEKTIPRLNDIICVVKVGILGDRLGHADIHGKDPWRIAQ